MQRHETNFTALLAGLLFIGLGVYAIVVGANRLGDELRWVWPVTLLGLGAALLVGSSASEHGARHQIGAEGGEDGEIEQAGRSHDS